MQWRRYVQHLDAIDDNNDDEHVATTTTTTTTSRALVSGEYRLSDLQADFDQMVMYLSFNPQIFTNQAELAAVIATQRALLVHGMTQLDLYRIMAVVVATVRCGHSMIQVPASAIEQFFDNSLAYPVVVRLIDGKLTVIEVEGETNLAVGDTIESIEGKNVSAVTQDMMRYLAADGEGTSMKTKVLSENYFSYYMLYLGNDDAIEIEYREDLTQTIHNETLERNCANTHGWVERPAYESAFMSDYAVLTIRTFQPYGSYTLDGFYGFFDGFFKEVDRLNIQRVVLDLRGNGGGDPRVASRLLAYLIASPQPYFAAQTSDYYPGLKNPVPLMQPHYDGCTRDHHRCLLLFDVRTFRGFASVSRYWNFCRRGNRRRIHLHG
ncbi:MAG: S41 family peptidase [Bacillus subtilis]|nr:S41 family peptidase [Bacillus subtilis]